ncbi:MAG: toxin-antitoxin (TA) system antitoxin [Chitinophagaceae bacterium]|nr:toxin-antitoxin (TA) system antitoxin [Anaerolineae bacterium]
MTTKTVDIQTTQMSVQELASLIQAGDEVMLTIHGKLLARIIPAQDPPDERILGLRPGLWMSDDFNDELPDSFWHE